MQIIRILRSVVFIAIFVDNVGCTTFKGPGEIGYHAQPLDADESPAITQSTGPNLRLRGQRKTVFPAEHLRFEWPVDEARLTRGFLLGPKSHWGADLANQRGTPVLASEAGVVVYTGRGFRGYGNLIVIEHNHEWATLYSHLDKIFVKEGEVIVRGHNIGKMGQTGRASGVHLHFEIRQNRQPVNPLAHLPEIY